MNTPTSGPFRQVVCGVCLGKTARSNALVSQTRDYVAYFCSPACYEDWQRRPLHEPRAGRAKPNER